VVRRFDRAVEGAVEARYGLPEGTILAAILEKPRLGDLVTGKLTWAQRNDEVVVSLAALVGGVDRARAMLDEWNAPRGEAVPEVVAFVADVRAAGRPVALTTNATDVLESDLVKIGLDGAFDAVVNSWRLGVAKPSRDYFLAACAAVRTPPDRCLFVDDSDRFVAGARAAGLPAHRWTGPADLPYLRAALGLAP
jgi:putative hydrolase of the HAD superfamily